MRSRATRLSATGTNRRMAAVSAPAAIGWTGTPGWTITGENAELTSMSDVETLSRLITVPVGATSRIQYEYVFWSSEMDRMSVVTSLAPAVPGGVAIFTRSSEVYEESGELLVIQNNSNSNQLLLSISVPFTVADFHFSINTFRTFTWG